MTSILIKNADVVVTMDEQRQENVTMQLSIALCQSDNADIKQTILNLAEFMDHSEKVR